MSDHAKLLKSAEKVIRAQERLLVAYRTGGRPPEWVFRDLAQHKPAWDVYLMDQDSRKES
jgi:hypothetical protein